MYPGSCALFVPDGVPKTFDDLYQLIDAATLGEQRATSNISMTIRCSKTSIAVV